MTLILARASPEFILQVTDRLVSFNKAPFDRVANKNLLYIASNAVVTLAYTGTAYLEGIPTDHWIAQILTGITINTQNPTAVMVGKRGPLRDVGYALRNLCEELNSRDHGKSLQLLISMQGYQWNSKGRLRPIVGTIARLRTQGAFGVCYQQRDWYLNGPQTISAPESNMSIEELTALSDSLRHKSTNEAERLLVEAIRRISKTNPWVGPHCISILIPRPSSPNISIRYHPAMSSTLPESQRLSDDEEPFGYSPWIIGADICLPPAEMVGAFTCRTGLFTINFTSGISEHSDWLQFHSGQKRSQWRQF